MVGYRNIEVEAIGLETQMFLKTLRSSVMQKNDIWNKQDVAMRRYVVGAQGFSLGDHMWKAGKEVGQTSGVGESCALEGARTFWKAAQNL